ncbi:hypothetical protein EDF42_1543 [Curtobacterium sp. PhB172]|nr:hypothetical protein EDF42_1543 [Curtobacterium sp. PhB172]
MECLSKPPPSSATHCSTSPISSDAPPPTRCSWGQALTACSIYPTTHPTVHTATPPEYPPGAVSCFSISAAQRQIERSSPSTPTRNPSPSLNRGETRGASPRRVRPPCSPTRRGKYLWDVAARYSAFDSADQLDRSSARCRTALRNTHAVSFVSPRPASTQTASRVMLRATASSRRISLSGSWNQAYTGIGCSSSRTSSPRASSSSENGCGGTQRFERRRPTTRIVRTGTDAWNAAV